MYSSSKGEQEDHIAGSQVIYNKSGKMQNNNYYPMMVGNVNWFHTQFDDGILLLSGLILNRVHGICGTYFYWVLVHSSQIGIYILLRDCQARL